MISLPLDVTHKITWCQTLLERVRTACAEYSASAPAGVEAFADPELNLEAEQKGFTTWQLMTVVHSKPPLDLAFLVGDLIQNLRSALDYLAQALVATTDGVPSNGPAGTSFPVVAERKEPARKIRIKGCRSSLVNELVEQMQPFNIDNYRSHPLFRINYLANEYKHRELRLTETVAGYPSYFAIVDRTAKPFVGASIPNLRYMTDRDRLDPLIWGFRNGVVPEGFGEFEVKISLDLGKVQISDLCGELEYYLTYVKNFVVPTFKEVFASPWPSDVFELRDVPDPARLSPELPVEQVISGYLEFLTNNFGAIEENRIMMLPMFEGLNSEKNRGW